MTRLSCCTFLLLPLCAPGWTGPAAGDLLPPTVVITGPSDTTCYASSASTITLSGYAGDDTGIVSATWANDREGSGSFSPAAHWAVTDIDLAPGLRNNRQCVRRFRQDGWRPHSGRIRPYGVGAYIECKESRFRLRVSGGQDGQRGLRRILLHPGGGPFLRPQGQAHCDAAPACRRSEG